MVCGALTPVTGPLGHVVLVVRLVVLVLVLVLVLCACGCSSALPLLLLQDLQHSRPELGLLLQHHGKLWVAVQQRGHACKPARRAHSDHDLVHNVARRGACAATLAAAAASCDGAAASILVRAAAACCCRLALAGCWQRQLQRHRQRRGSCRVQGPGNRNSCRGWVRRQRGSGRRVELRRRRRRWRQHLLLLALLLSVPLPPPLLVPRLCLALHLLLQPGLKSHSRRRQLDAFACLRDAAAAGAGRPLAGRGVLRALLAAATATGTPAAAAHAVVA
jgi:hypothetical protein